MTNYSLLYFGARNTCLEMLRDRGCDVPAHLQLTEKEFGIMYDNDKLDIIGINDENKIPVYVKIVRHDSTVSKPSEYKRVLDEIAESTMFKKLGLLGEKDTGYQAMEILLKSRSIHIIVIYNPRHQGKTHSKYEEDHIGNNLLEVFNVYSLNINPTKHVYQPKFRLIKNQDEILSKYQKYDAKPILFSSICIDDPINRYYGGNLGELYEITRNGVNIFYRKIIGKRMNIK
jgi:DNA-directed RNA polymerase subunit H (RpoH/RPB5)